MGTIHRLRRTGDYSRTTIWHARSLAVAQVPENNRERLRCCGDAIDHRWDLAALGVAGEAGGGDSFHVLFHCQADELRSRDAALVHLRLFESAAADDDHRLEALLRRRAGASESCAAEERALAEHFEQPRRVEHLRAHPAFQLEEVLVD